MQKSDNWKTIKDDGMPPIGKCLIVTIRNNLAGGKRELRYPVYYMESPTEPGYSFFCGGTDNVLMKEYSEVIAWTPMPEPFDGEVEE